MGDIKLYGIPLSPPSRCVHLTLKLLDIKHEYIEVDVLGGGTNTPEFLAMNPQHTVPVLTHGNFALSESRAILVYLCEAFGADRYYPKGKPKTTAIINQRMNFDIGILYKTIANAVIPVCFKQRHHVEEKDKKSVDEVMQWTDNYLDDSTYFAGDFLSVADISLLAAVTTYEACMKAFGPLSKYPNVEKWLNNMKKELPGYAEVGEPGMIDYKNWFEESFMDTKDEVTNIDI